MGHHLASLHASSIEIQNSSEVVCWRAGLKGWHEVGPRVHVGFSSDAISLQAWHGAQLQQIHLGFVNYRSELYNQLVYISTSAERFQKQRAG